ncbi:hypothetical protein [Streptomyces sp. A1136]|uniref:hypothetical protein n=1 Tax=Streptomyces sp. A1136 TaxID=2563102 RepID=UPI00109E5A84|nr:hypothetical protein [Streptomyces sp. A1136]THA47752.1 hypothetical protein E6R62_30770 [Streptomyces sp. A1136]
MSAPKSYCARSNPASTVGGAGFDEGGQAYGHGGQVGVEVDVRHAAQPPERGPFDGFEDLPVGPVDGADGRQGGAARVERDIGVVPQRGWWSP